MASDVVAELLATIREVVECDDAAAKAAEQLIRERFGGRSVRISRMSPAPTITIEAIDAKLRQRMSVRQIAQESGLSRMTIYRCLDKHRKSQRNKP